MTLQAPTQSNFLSPGERILWQGRPRVALDLPTIMSADWKGMGGGLFMAGFALFWTVMASQSGAPLLFTFFGLFLLIQGVISALRPVIWPLFLRTRSYYTLTDQRAYIVTDVPGKGRRMTSTEIGNQTLVEWVDSNPPSLIFGPYGMDNRLTFHNIDEAERVMRLIRDLQSGGQIAANRASPYGGDWQGASQAPQAGDRIPARDPNIPPPLPSEPQDKGRS
ncbi:MAG: hypothetical protein Q4G36_11480 [Paracoccus sp. (in: a-proteobacteria)]|nr:hypothetical protein [Paracoccus sp. (in: a-proteobacteria)]